MWQVQDKITEQINKYKQELDFDVSDLIYILRKKGEQTDCLSDKLDYFFI